MDALIISAPLIPSRMHDALDVPGAGVALLVGLIVVNLRFLLPGQLAPRAQRHADPCGGLQRFGPVAGTNISEPAPHRAASPETNGARHHVARPHIWRFLSGGAASFLAPPVVTGKR